MKHLIQKILSYLIYPIKFIKSEPRSNLALRIQKSKYRYIFQSPSTTNLLPTSSSVVDYQAISQPIVTEDAQNLNYLKILPLEIILQILSHLEYPDIFNLAVIDKHCHQIIEENIFYISKQMNDRSLTSLYKELPLEYYKIANKYDEIYFSSNTYKRLRKICKFLRFPSYIYDNRIIKPPHIKGYFDNISNIQYFQRLYKFSSTVCGLMKYTTRLPDSPDIYNINEKNLRSIFSYNHKNFSIPGRRLPISNDLHQQYLRLSYKPCSPEMENLFKIVSDQLVNLIRSRASGIGNEFWSVTISYTLRSNLQFPRTKINESIEILTRLLHPSNTLKLLRYGKTDIEIFEKYTRALYIVQEVRRLHGPKGHHLSNTNITSVAFSDIQWVFRNRKDEILIFRDWDTLDKSWWKNRRILNSSLQTIRRNTE